MRLLKRQHSTPYAWIADYTFFCRFAEFSAGILPSLTKRVAFQGYRCVFSAQSQGGSMGGLPYHVVTVKCKRFPAVMPLCSVCSVPLFTIGINNLLDSERSVTIYNVKTLGGSPLGTISIEARWFSRIVCWKRFRSACSLRDTMELPEFLTPTGWLDKSYYYQNCHMKLEDFPIILKTTWTKVDFSR